MRAASLVITAGFFLFSLALLPAVASGQRLAWFVFAADPLAVFMALTSSLIGLIIIVYSFDYISHYENQQEYYFMVALFLGAMMGLVYANNLIFLYIFWEITAIASWRLIGFYRSDRDLIKADKALLVTFFGAAIMLIAFIAIFQQTGTFNLSLMQGRLISGGLVGLVLFGILSKSATLPFQSWLPDAGVAPSPVTALLHAAVLVKIGVYVFARLFVATFVIEAFWHTAVPLIAGGSALIAAGAAMVETDIKRVIAYSTISQIGFIFLGLAVGNIIGVVGGMLYILMHGLAKAGLFLSAGIIEQNTHNKDITKMGGLIKTMPFTAVAFLLCAFSVMGIPPLGGFFSKYMVIAAAAKQGDIFITFLFLAGAVMSILYLFRLFNLVFLGEARGPLAPEKSALMVGCVVALAGLSLAAGLLVNYPLGFLGMAVAHLPGVVR